MLGFASLHPTYEWYFFLRAKVLSVGRIFSTRLSDRSATPTPIAQLGKS
ncbi:MAG: hypothetical protein SXA11_14215 [Cyanobacteriota bacterium]|nr:hypothetical protein [Cyanobacteriota bacterium]